MKKIILASLLSIFTLYASSENNSSNSLWDRVSTNVSDDYSNFYRLDRWSRIGIAFGVGAIMANTDIDQSIQTKYQNDFRSSTTDDFAEIAKTFGEGSIMIPLSLLASTWYYVDEDSDFTTWGSTTARAYFVGAPVLLSTQYITGGSRPDEQSYDSRWNPFNDVNGVSGHAFMGAVPFLTLSKIYKDNVYAKYFFISASFLTGWSRVNDNQHYTSQALLGWYLAYESVDAVFSKNTDPRKTSYIPFVQNTQDNQYYGLALVKRW